MKSFVRIVVVAGLLLGFNAQAAILTGSLGTYDTEIVDSAGISAQSGTVGGLSIDPILAYTSLGNSGDRTELDWMGAVYDHLDLGVAPISISRIEFATDADSDAFWTDLGGGIYTGDLLSESEHYLLKIGQGQVDYDTFLYDNLFSLGQATINLATLRDFSGFTGQDFDIYRVSHLSVPEPSVLALFLAGIAGLGLARRKIRL